MDNNIKKKNIILSLVIVLVGILLAGGTYAYLTFTINVTNNIVNGSTTCFDIDYLDTNQITGTLFPSSGPAKGLLGQVSLKVNNACDLVGVGNLYIHVNSGTSTKFTTTVAAHCESPYTLKTLTEYTTSSDCTSNNGIWVTNGTPLKYAIYNNNTATGSPIDVGYINAIDSDIAIYRTFIINKYQRNLYIFLWLDGYLTDNTYTNLPFDGYVKADAIQNNPNSTFYLPRMYQRVEYVSGNSRVVTTLIPTNNYGIYARIKTGSVPNDSIPYVYFGSSDSSMSAKRFYVALKSGLFVFGWNTSEIATNISVNTTNINVIKMNYLNSRKLEVDNTVVSTNIPTLASTTFPIHLFGLNRGGSNTNSSVTYSLYELKVSDGGAVISEFIPCYSRGDNAIGFYDIINNEFYTKPSGFSKGPDVN